MTDNNKNNNNNVVTLNTLDKFRAEQQTQINQFVRKLMAANDAFERRMNQMFRRVKEGRD